MSLAWPMLAAVGAAGATWLYEWSPARNPPDSGAVRSCDLPLPLILEMLSVAIRQGASIPRALIAVGNIVEGEFGGGLRSAGERLNSGMPWCHGMRHGLTMMIAPWSVTHSPHHGRAAPRR